MASVQIGLHSGHVMQSDSTVMQNSLMYWCICKRCRIWISCSVIYYLFYFRIYVLPLLIPTSLCQLWAVYISVSNNISYFVFTINWTELIRKLPDVWTGVCCCDSETLTLNQTKFSSCCILQPNTWLNTKNPYPIPGTLFSRNLVTIAVPQTEWPRNFPCFSF